MRTLFASDFSRDLRAIRDDYTARLAETRRVAKRPANGMCLVDPEKETELEWHTRAWLIDGILRALNWPIESSSHSTGFTDVELQLRSAKHRGVQFADYGLFEQGFPLAVIEAKASGEGLPRDTSTGDIIDFIRNYDSEHCRSGFADLQRWLFVQLAGYVERIHQRYGDWPLRAVLTNGHWWVIVSDPRILLASERGAVDRLEVLAILDIFDCDDAALKSVIDLLEFGLLQKRQSASTIAGCRSRVVDLKIEAILRGVCIEVAMNKSLDDEEYPVYTVSPMIFLENSRAWIAIKSEV